MTDVQVDIPEQENESFSYDAVGNRLNEEGVEGEWAYNDNNKLLTVAKTEYTYDANGNARQLLLDGTVMFTYHYNAQDRLVKVDDVNGSTIADYAYDPFGRRLWKDVGGTRTYFFYADEGLVAEYDTNGAEIRSYGYRPDSTWTTDPLWLKQNDEYFFYQNDHLGTPQKLVQMNGAIAWSVQYTAFGKASVEIETVENNFRFPGQYVDAETGESYNRHRYYASGIGRYLRGDPIGIAGGMNLFSYANNNPLLNKDPFGLLVHGDGIGIGIGFGIPYIPKPQWGGAGSILRVYDNYGNIGIAVCGGTGPAFGTGIITGIQGTDFYLADTVCDIEGFSDFIGQGDYSAGGGFGYQGAVYAELGFHDLTVSSLTLIAGIGIGGWGAATGMASGCKLIGAVSKCGKKICNTSPLITLKPPLPRPHQAHPYLYPGYGEYWGPGTK